MTRTIGESLLTILCKPLDIQLPSSNVSSLDGTNMLKPLPMAITKKYLQALQCQTAKNNGKASCLTSAHTRGKRISLAVLNLSTKQVLIY